MKKETESASNLFFFLSLVFVLNFFYSVESEKQMVERTNRIGY